MRKSWALPYTNLLRARIRWLNRDASRRSGKILVHLPSKAEAAENRCLARCFLTIKRAHRDRHRLLAKPVLLPK
jgi:hypothetical protein